MAHVIDTIKPEFIVYPSYDVNIDISADVFRQEGDLTYSFTPFRNMRLADAPDPANPTMSVGGKLDYMTTDKLGFRLNSPVSLAIQPSYDGTANVIINDDLNPPRIINSRFSVVEDKRFMIHDRNGDNDTNIYDELDIDLQTRLFKNYSMIPYVDFIGVEDGGNLKAGNYAFYFKYVDADGNESDIICESGIIPIHDGMVNSVSSISGGVENQNCNKLIKLKLNNIDTSYDYVHVYLSRISGADSITEISEFQLIQDKKIIDTNTVDITISGFETFKTISQDSINIKYNMVSSVKTHT